MTGTPLAQVSDRVGAEGSRRDRPIIMSAPMVRDLLAGAKTQTRRILKPQPPTPEQFPGSVFGFDRSVAEGVKVYSLNDLDRLPKHPTKWDLCGPVGVARDAGFPTTYHVPYAIGDRLWVRETWATWMHAPSLPLGMGGKLSADPGEVVYKATDPEWDHLMADRASLRELAAKREDGRTGNWVVRSPIHMPRTFSRLILTVTEVRVQRLQDISEEDARAEGWPYAEADSTRIPSGAKTPIGWFRMLWGDLHGPESWGASPWVAAVSFTTTPANIDSLPEQAGGRA